MDEVRQIDRCSVVDTAITEGSNFVGDSGLNWKPVKGYKMLCDVGGFGVNAQLKSCLLETRSRCYGC